MKRIIGLFAIVFLATAAFAAEEIRPDAPKVLVIGDSLSAGHGIDPGQGWVNLLQRRLESRGYPHQVINRSKHGRTTKRALRDLSWFIETTRPQVVLIELGGVDGFLNLPIDVLRENLSELVETARSHGARVALFEMVLPLDEQASRRGYSTAFRGTFHQVAQAEGAQLVPFFLASFADSRESFQEDGIHPRAEVQAQMLNAAWPTVQKLLPPPRQLRAAAPAHESSDSGGGQN